MHLEPEAFIETDAIRPQDVHLHLLWLKGKTGYRTTIAWIARDASNAYTDKKDLYRSASHCEETKDSPNGSISPFIMRRTRPFGSDRRT